LYHQLKLPYPLVVVAVGDTAYRTCMGYQTYARLSCWKPKTASQVHRFTIIFYLLQLGIEALYFDLDTFAVQDFVTPILEQADRGRLEAEDGRVRKNKDGSFSRRMPDGSWKTEEEGSSPGDGDILIQQSPGHRATRPTSHDILFPQHPDGPCINIGLFYIRPSLTTLQWFHDFLEWYHSYPYEVDQRGLDALTYVNSSLKVSHQPTRADTHSLARPWYLDSLQTFVMQAERGPWMGRHEDVKFMHWFSRPFDDKFPEIQLAYDTADAVHADGLEMQQAFRMLREIDELGGDVKARREAIAQIKPSLRFVQLLREQMDRYWVPKAPLKPNCW